MALKTLLHGFKMTAKSRLAAVFCGLLFLASCATSSEPAPQGADPQGPSLLQAIEESARMLASDLPQGARVAVAAFEAESEGLSAFIMEELAAALTGRGIAVVARSGLDAVLAELDFQMTGLVSDETAASLGRFLGAEFVITGQLLDLGSLWRLGPNAVSVETAVRVSSPRLDVPDSEALRSVAAALGAPRAAAQAAPAAAFQQAHEGPSWDWASRAAWSPVSAGGNRTAAVGPDGSLWAWGAGAGPLPERVEGPASVWASVSNGGGFTVAIDAQGRLWAWGLNNRGQLGDGTAVNRDAPVRVQTDLSFAQVCAGAMHTAAIATDGSLWAWGQNVNGELGQGRSSLDIRAPVRVGDGYGWAHVASGFGHTAAVGTDGSLWAWGLNNHGQLGLGTAGERDWRASPARVGAGTDWVYVAAGWHHTLAIRRDFSLWTWGQNRAGQLGDDTTADRHSPAQVGSAVNWVSVSAGQEHSVGLGMDGSLWAWGSNMNGRIGNGASGGGWANNVRTPARIADGQPWAFISAGSQHTAALAQDGSLWTWGAGGAGRLGNGAPSGDAHSPGQVPGIPRLLAGGF